MKVLCLFVALQFAFGNGNKLFGSEPNPPSWPDSVSIFSPETPSGDIAAVVNAAYAVNGGDPTVYCSNGQFSNERFAFMFLPGTYENLDVPIGYYTSAYGLGTAPTDTIFNGGKGVFCEEACGSFTTGALDTFWRSAENFHTATNYAWPVGTGMTWAVSQAAPLRNVKVDNDLLLFEYLDSFCCAAGYASGGWLSGADVTGKVSFGSQQQFMVRSSSSAAGFERPVWNGVFAATSGAPDAQCGALMDDGNSANASISVEPNVPLLAEKPYITSTDGSSFKLVIPAVQTDTAAGVGWTSTGFADATTVDFNDVYVTQPNDTSAIINAKLLLGYHVVVTPGIYTLDASLHLTHENQVLLGLGLATLIAPANGDPCIKIADVSGVRVAGVLLEAGQWETTGAMLQVGESGTFAGDAANPVVLTDVFVRVGGPNTGVGPVDAMVLIQSGYTVIDNTWLWRADHTAEGLVYNSENPVNHGLVVKADNVFAYGLAAEHTIEDNVLWEGDAGLTYFYQAEIMYDTLEPTWDYSCYKLGDDVQTHTATGLGCYSYFRDSSGYAEKGVSTPAGATGINIDKAVSVFLDGQTASGINNVINDDGKAVSYDSRVQYHCDI